MADRILLLVGTKKGAFILESDAARRSWAIRGPSCEGYPIQDISRDPATGTLYAGGGSPWYGPTVFRSDDLGATWTQSSDGMTYGDDGPKISAVWNVTAAHGSVYAGVGPAGLFRSDDGGRTWAHVEGLTNHPSRPTWQPGAGGLILHTIVPHPTDRDRMWVAISAVGTFETRDGGASWEPRNRGVRADFMPDPHPVTGQCVHKLVMAAGEPERLYQQNHCGQYRSTDGGLTWQDISAGLPSEFGFPMVAHPRDPLDGLGHPADLRRRRAGSCPTARPPSGGPTTPATTGSAATPGCPRRTPTSGSSARRWPATSSIRSGCTSGRAPASCSGAPTAARAGARSSTTLPPIWSVEAVVA